ncbi:DUF6231 family protein [Plasticicumulans acidivorans]|uniref:Uncharacterized protein n=1 Tax=Plasticicumulans acidivorans TaxID=886464 RepID=A0A317MU11_9GAMM|nr:DUF6231 family protein [Plasticicumulans acidivorans]PWV60595.1 hypothetical protein C7443_107170 [Plasticicumulans acidivorans]
MTAITHDCPAAIRHWLAELAPPTLLLIADADTELTAQLTPAADCVVTRLPIEQVADSQHAAVLLLDGLERLPADDARHLLARLRDHQCHDGLIRSPRTLWDDSAWLGLGFTLPASDATHRLARWSLAEYKTVPDWLNAKFWANPERWQP